MMLLFFGHFLKMASTVGVKFHYADRNGVRATYNLTSDAFPQGREFCVNDVLHKLSGGKYIVTRSGSYIPSGDLIKAAAVGQDYIESTNAKPWGSTAGKTAGTEIIIPGGAAGGGSLTAVITQSSRAVSGYYRVYISPALGAAVTENTEISSAHPIALNDGYIEVS